MAANTDKLLADLLGEFQALRVEVTLLRAELVEVKLGVVLTVKATPHKRKRRRKSPKPEDPPSWENYRHRVGKGE